MFAINKKLPASYRITDKCVGCGICKKKCPWFAIVGEKKEVHLIEPTLCQGCGTCWHACPKCAVEDSHGVVRDKAIRPQKTKAQIDEDVCVGCQNCLFNCEQEAIEHQNGIMTGRCKVDPDKCAGCGSCLSYCAGSCISVG